ncbi:Rv1355c family protein [Rhodococcus rhodochrous]|uniref:Rv1355c family protein n=1 Tax=Rhodococcus rhodochrous TaxID=1829 RepID=UPI001329DC95|nr:Rv1355c family protein [Rhodococcus rhodochrous]
MTSGDETPGAPMILMEGDEADRLRSNPHISVTDRLLAQQEALREVLPAPEDELLTESPRWVYYPWRNSIVHILGPHGFRRLRLDRNRNKLTAAEQERLAERVVGVVGLSVGSAVAQAVALEGLCGEMRLADFDVLELSNLNRVPASVLDLGVNKAVVTARRLWEIDPYLSISLWPDGIRPETVNAFVDGLDLLIDECDSLDMKVLMRLEACRRRVPVVMETSDRGLIDVERFDLEATTPFHGLLGDIDIEQLAGLTDREKIPFALQLLGADSISSRMAASLLEVNRTLATWPQLGGEVMLGAATVATVIRRVLLGRPVPSGRGRVDLDSFIERLRGPEPAAPTLVGHRIRRVPDEPVAAVVHAAERAPSGGNSQPWSLRIESGDLRIEIGDHFGYSGIDIRCRGSYVALGAALQNARIAAAAHGILGPAYIEGRAGRLSPWDVVAGLRFGSGTDEELAASYQAMLSRATTRKMGDGRPLPVGAREVLYRAAGSVGGRIDVITDPARLDRIADIFAEADRIRYLDAGLRREMIAELRWPSDGSDTGIDIASLGLDDAESVMLEIVLRDDVLDQLREWDLGHALGRPVADRIRSSSAFVAVFSEGVEATDYVRAGVLMESVWIVAHRLGLAVQPMTPVFMYAEDAEDLLELSPAYAQRMEKLRWLLDDVVERPGDARIAMLLRVARVPLEPPRSVRRSDTIFRKSVT